MKTQNARVAQIEAPEEGLGAKGSYLEALHLVERLHRRLLDVIKDEFERRGRALGHGVWDLLYDRVPTSPHGMAD